MVGTLTLLLFTVSLTIQNRLVGDKCTLADISFIKCNEYAVRYLLRDDFDFKTEFPHAYRWHRSLMSRPAVKWVFHYKEHQDCGRERQHVTGETHSSFADRAKGIARNAVVVKSTPIIEAAAN